MKHRRSRSASPSKANLLLASLLVGISTALVASWIWRRKAAPRSDSGTSVINGVHESAPHQPQEQQSDVQSVSDGSGPLVHRRYSVLIESSMSATELFDVMALNVAEFAPAALADFTKSVGKDASLEEGDEFDISMLGPWNGRVRVTSKSDTSFTLVTLVGHPEAGHIVFSTQSTSEPGKVAARIESWARARNALVELTYATLGVGKQVQTEVWVTFLQRLSASTGSNDTPEVNVSTEFQESDHTEHSSSA